MMLSFPQPPSSTPGLACNSPPWFCTVLLSPRNFGTHLQGSLSNRLFLPPCILSSSPFLAPISTHQRTRGRGVRKRCKDGEKRSVRHLECPCSFKCQFEATSITDLAGGEKWIPRPNIYTSRVPNDTSTKDVLMSLCSRIIREH